MGPPTDAAMSRSRCATFDAIQGWWEILDLPPHGMVRVALSG